MADTNPPKGQTPSREGSGRRQWSAPQLLEYGHIGKLTQGASGTMSETGGKKTCL